LVAQTAGMPFSAAHGALAGALVTGAIVAFIVRPAALVPHAAPTPSLAFGSAEDAPRPVTHAPPSPAHALVYVAGAVAHAGVYVLAADARAADALAKAGGFTRDADPVAVNLAARVADGDEIAVPRLGEGTAPAAHRRVGGPAKKRTRRGRKRRAEGDDALASGDAAAPTIDLNTADATTLATIPGVGPTLAQRIVDFRSLNGPFASVDGLADVAGITASRLDAIEPSLTVRP